MFNRKGMHLGIDYSQCRLRQGIEEIRKTSELAVQALNSGEGAQEKHQENGRENRGRLKEGKRWAVEVWLCRLLVSAFARSFQDGLQSWLFLCCVRKTVPLRSACKRRDHSGHGKNTWAFRGSQVRQVMFSCNTSC